jgi:hypothetical protein
MAHEGVSRTVFHIDVVEKNPTVAALIGRYLPEDRVTVTIGDAFEVEWPPDTRWDLAWHDIWPEIRDPILPGMYQLRKKYRGRVGWQDCWQRAGCIEMANTEIHTEHYIRTGK